MAARANWKGYLRLSLVSCPIALYPASSEREKISFHQINSKTGNRVKMSRVDAVTSEPVEWDDIVKGYEVGKRSPSRAAARSRSTSSCRERRSTTSTTCAPTSSPPRER